MDLLSWSRHWRCMPGQGDLTVDAFIAALGATGYEAGSRWRFSTTVPRRLGPRGRDRRAPLAVGLLDDAARAEPARRREIPRLPPRSPVEVSSSSSSP